MNDNNERKLNFDQLVAASSGDLEGVDSLHPNSLHLAEIVFEPAH